MEHTLFYNYLILFGSATTAVIILHYLRFPSIVSFLLAGVLIGPQGFKLISEQTGSDVISELAVVLLMFTIGLEFSLRTLAQMKRAFLGLGTLQFVVTTCVFAALFYWAFHEAWPRAVLFGLLGFMSSTAIVLKLMREHYDSSANSPYSNSTVGILLFQDLASIPCMLCVPLLAKLHFGEEIHLDLSPSSVAIHGALLIGVVVLIRFGMMVKFLDLVAATRSRETFFFAMLGLCFAFATGAHAIGLSYPLGAFLGGVLIAETPYGRQGASEVIPLRDTFLGVFFMSLGMLIDPKFLLAHLPHVAALSFMVCLVKSGSIYGIARFLRYPHAVALMVAGFLFQIGEFSLVLAGEGLKHKLMTEIQFQYFLTVSVISMIITPLGPRLASKILIKIRHAPLRTSRGKGTGITTLGNHCIIIGYGPTGKRVAEALRSLDIDYCVIDLNSKTIRNLQVEGDGAIYGDGSEEEILREADIFGAKMVIITVSGRHMVHGILTTLERLQTKARAIVRVQFAREADELKRFRKAEIIVAEEEAAAAVVNKTLEIFDYSDDERQLYSNH